ncbi:MAG: hypothetical protein IJL66_01410 [Lachnospiraceae bacterium]|nr:hypothetical protein [Lachnospiraceae bacterium]
MGKKQYDDDDGRTIADMNIDGMPWYVQGDENRAPAGEGEHYQMSKEESRAYTWAALKAALLVAVIFGVVFFLFIAFADFIWLN